MSELPNNCKRLREQLKKSLEREEAIEKELEMSLAQVKEREHEIEEIEVKCCACHAGHIAQIAVLRGALEEVGKGHIESRFDHEDGRFVEVFVRDVHIVIDQALEKTPSEAAERVQKLVAALEEIRCLADCDDFGNHSISIAENAEKALSEWKKP